MVATVLGRPETTTVALGSWTTRAVEVLTAVRMREPADLGTTRVTTEKLSHRDLEARPTDVGTIDDEEPVSYRYWGSPAQD